MEQPRTPANLYFPALTGLRAVAAYMVYAHHAKPQVPFATHLFNNLFQEAHTGVSIFFVLSGFLIGLRYSGSFQEGKRKPWKNYLLHRFARIYPLYFLCTLLALCFNHDFRWSSWIINLLLGQGLFPGYTFSGIGVGWTLTVEAFFYLVAPLVLLFWNRFSWLTWVLITYLIGAGLLALGQFSWPIAFVPDWGFLVRLTFFGRCFEFYLGIWLAQNYLHQTSRTPYLPSSGSGLKTYGGVLGMLFLLLLIPAIRGEQAPTQLPTYLALGFIGIYNILLPLIIGLFIWGLVQEKTWISRLLGSRVAEALGKGSYIFYLVHYTFGFDLLYFHVWENRGGVLLLLALLSVPGYHLFEAPLHRLVLRFGKGRLNKP